MSIEALSPYMHGCRGGSFNDPHFAIRRRQLLGGLDNLPLPLDMNRLGDVKLPFAVPNVLSMKQRSPLDNPKAATNPTPVVATSISSPPTPIISTVNTTTTIATTTPVALLSTVPAPETSCLNDTVTEIEINSLFFWGGANTTVMLCANITLLVSSLVYSNLRLQLTSIILSFKIQSCLLRRIKPWKLLDYLLAIVERS